MADSDDILFSARDHLARVVLNRPKALNALTLGMIRTFAPRLRAWADDPGIGAVLVRGAGERAFCAGGDVRAVYDAGRGLKGEDDLKRSFFREEYQLNRLIHRFPKPYVALIDGITMGGGVGVSVHGSHRIAGDRTMIAMPETAIGLFPDVGATWFLNRAPGQVGVYVALTGYRLQASDALYCGIATHYVPSARGEALDGAIADAVRGGGDVGRAIEAAVARLAGDPGAPPLAAQRAAIDRCFAGDRVEDILAALRQEDSAWARETAETLAKKSPTSLKIALRQLRLGRGLDIEAALALEYRMTQHVMESHDFFEGIRAVLVDKDHAPRWQPARLEEVGEDVVAGYFREIGAHELRFADERKGRAAE